MQIRANMQDEWLQQLPNHPIFSVPPSNVSADDSFEAPPKSTRRTNKMCFRGSDLILAVGHELRIATFVDYKSGANSSESTFKTLHTPNIQFTIEQVTLCPGGKMLAVAGQRQVAVVVLPRPSYYKLVNPRIDCKSIQVGQYYHATPAASSVAKIDWHPWHDGGSSLLVLTTDGLLREYDVSQDAEEPQQLVSFVPPAPKKGTYSVDDDPLAREASSFCVGGGRADWSPLTVYGLMRNGDIWAISPFLPSNGLVPASYIPALQIFVSTKRELIEAGTSALILSLSSRPAGPGDDGEEEQFANAAITNDHQMKYVNTLMKQIARNPKKLREEDDGSNKGGFINVHPPKNTLPPARQGPFVLYPTPKELDPGSVDMIPDATDIIYLGFGGPEKDGVERDDNEATSSTDTDAVGVLSVVFSDGRVDVCLDLEAVEAKWETSRAPSHSAKQGDKTVDLPTLTVYETIDLGLLAMLTKEESSSASISQSLLETNHPVLHFDPITSGRVYISHSFGVHVIDMSGWMRAITKGLRAEEDGVGENLAQLLQAAQGSEVGFVLNTLSVDGRTSTPITSLAIVDNGFISYTLFMLTSEYVMVPMELSLRPSTPPPAPAVPLPDPSPSQPHTISSSLGKAPEGGYISLLTASPFTAPQFRPARPMSLPRSSFSNTLNQPSSQTYRHEITPDLLRQFGKRVESLRSDIRDMTSGVNAVQARIELQSKELDRQLDKLAEIDGIIGVATAPAPTTTSQQHSPSLAALTQRMERVTTDQKEIIKKMDRVLQRLLDGYSPKLSEHEVKWFAELDRMRREVSGSDGRTGSLKERAETVKHQLEYLRPKLEEINKRGDEKKKVASAASHLGLGSVQLKTVQRRLADATKMLEGTKAQAERMNKWLEEHDVSGGI